MNNQRIILSQYFWPGSVHAIIETDKDKQTNKEFNTNFNRNQDTHIPIENSSRLAFIVCTLSTITCGLNIIIQRKSISTVAYQRRRGRPASSGTQKGV